MRVLITTNAATGHFLPMVPTAHALVEAGHEVRVACPASFALSVEGAGLAPMGCDEDVIDVQVAPAPPRDDRDARLAWAITTSWPSDARTWLRDLLRRATAWGPELVMVEPVEHAGRVLAAVLEIPLVEHGWGFTLPAAMTHAGTQSLRDVYSAAGVTPRHPALTIDLGPAQMQADDAPAVDRYRYTPWSPPGRSLPPADGRLRLLVTLGTYAHPDAASRLRAVVAGGREHGAQVVAVLGNHDRGSSADFPADVSVLDWVHMADAVASCDVIVHHGGAGTSWISLLAGRAALVIPQAGDQFRNAHLLEQAGVARVIDADRCDTSAIRHGLDELTCTPAFTERARAVAAANEGLPGVQQLAMIIGAHRPGK